METEQFTKLKPNTISSSCGFSVALYGRSTIEYREGAKLAIIGAELLSDGIAVFYESFNGWQAPNDAEIFSEEKKKEIVENIKRAYASEGEVITVM